MLIFSQIFEKTALFDSSYKKRTQAFLSAFFIIGKYFSIDTKAILAAAIPFKLKGLAVGAGNNGRIVFVSAYLDAFKTAIIIAAAVMLTIVYGTFDRSVCKFSSHSVFSLFEKLDGSSVTFMLCFF